MTLQLEVKMTLNFHHNTQPISLVLALTRLSLAHRVYGTTFRQKRGGRARR